MVALPIAGRWTVRQLGESHRDRALEFLRREPVLNVYLISKILDEGFAPPGQLVEISHRDEPVMISTLGTNIVMSTSHGIDREKIATAVEMLADRVITRAIPVRAIISEMVLVERLWRVLQSRFDQPTVVRLNQPVYALASRGDFPDLGVVRYARPEEVDLVVPACAAMHREEVGIDPLERDAVGYRARIRELIAARRSLVWIDQGRIAFKCEYSAVAPEAVQLMGVWTAPDLRGRGFAKRGLAEVCGHILASNRTVTLFVNDFNLPAIRLYEGLGFRKIGANRALIW